MTKDILSIAVEIFTIAIGLLFVGLNLLIIVAAFRHKGPTENSHTRYNDKPENPIK